ncbi:MAG: SIR2 family protein [Bdellovibrionales bacterium]
MENLPKYKLLSSETAGGKPNLLDGKTAEEGLRRIQALLADWLRMENVVVLTAAGCSFACGGRLMAGPKDNNLECVVLNAVEAAQLDENAKAVIQHRKSTWPEDDAYGPFGFEEWLSYVFNAPSLSQPASSPIKSVIWKTIKDQEEKGLALDDKDLTSLRSLIEKAIYAECSLQIDRTELSSDHEQKTSGHIPFLAKLIARDANLGRTHLFTLNYDTLFEQAMEELGIQYFDGFSGKACSRFDPSVYGLDIYYPGDVAEGRVRRFDKFLQFYKLHGSLHWSFDEKNICRAKHQDFDFVKDYKEQTNEKKAERLISKEFGAITSYGILPTSQKFSQTLEMPYAHLFRLFHARLNQPQTFLLVLGYGFGDEHVTRIIETALMNPSLVMLVVEPNPNSLVVKKILNYQKLGQRAFVLTSSDESWKKNPYQYATFSDFAQNIMPDIKWLEDFKRLRSFEEQIGNAQKDGAPSAMLSEG